MTLLLDIATLSALLLTLTAVPVLGLRHEARITSRIRAAERSREEEFLRARREETKSARVEEIKPARRLGADQPARLTDRSPSGV